MTVPVAQTPCQWPPRRGETHLVDRRRPDSVGYLTYFVFALASISRPFKEASQLSYDAALILMIMLVPIILAGRLVIVLSRRHAE